MTYSITHGEFLAKLGTVRQSTSVFRDAVQEALYAATYLCLKHSGGTEPFNEVLKSVGNAAHLKGISTWMETFAPTRMVNGKVLLHKDNWSKLDREAACADFDKFMDDSGVNEEGKKWYQIAKESNTTESIFNAESRVNSLLKALQKHEYGVLAGYITKAVESYNAAQSEIQAIEGSIAAGEAQVAA